MPFPQNSGGYDLYEWRDEHAPSRVSIKSAAELIRRRTDWRLGIIVAPFDTEDSIPDLDELANGFGIPREFRDERENGVTHSFGTRVNGDGSESIWLHFLGEMPSQQLDDPISRWIHFGFFMTWTPCKVADGDRQKHFPWAEKLTLVVFEPPAPLLEMISSRLLVDKSKWSEALEDPYVLLDMAFHAWYQRIEEASWEMTFRTRDVEKTVFNEARMMQGPQPRLPEIDLTLAHAIAKNAIYRLEGLDAILRCLELAVQFHELFHSTRLRSLSSQSRIKNVIDLSFHIQSMYDSKLVRYDSRSMRILSVLGVVFLPLSTVSTIFGTQFFTAVPEAVGFDGATVPSYMVVNSKFWLLWAVSLPLTLTIILGWLAWESGGTFGQGLRKLLGRRGRQLGPASVFVAGGSLDKR
ncbi:hypothetical protein B0H66DRAFT_587731 [Apodospora peruviana]|uniref:Uncharacterized protein n=1 Tax=Apodospora peruviana TaxID=516989 RepID=A0AAE0MAS9_9PEZI|nr:hypothetical protein B0H66DRAFT_587731 [Apodospora peruviana]